MTKIEGEYVDESLFPAMRRSTRWADVVQAFLKCPNKKVYRFLVPPDLRPRSIKYALKSHFRARQINPIPDVTYSKLDNRIWIRRKPNA
jgi:hypothetical protein